MIAVPSTFADALVTLYLAQVTAFSICIIVLRRSIGTGTLAMWLGANVVTALTLAFVRPAGTSFISDAQPLSMALVIIGADLRYLAFVGKRVRQKRMRPGNALAIIGALLMPLCFLPVLAPYRALILCVSGLLISIGILLAIIRNPEWRGLPGQRLLLLAIGVGLPGFLSRMLTAYPLGNMTRFIGNTQEQIISMAVLILVSFLYQLGFIVVMRDRAARLEHFAKRRLSRAAESARFFHESNDRMEKVAAERLRLLNILTHEVRQPLNNAQAAFSNIHMQLEQPTIKRESLARTVTKAQEVLDGVTLAISNAIIGATVIERGVGITIAPTSAVDVARLALTDCPDHVRGRVTLQSPPFSPFLHIDPVIVRLALRNLLDNAFKYSPAGSPVLFDIHVDEDRCGVAFRVTNAITDASLLGDKIFERDERGQSAEVEGKGLGLFIVKEVARIHHGEARYWLEDDGRATFELFLRD